jgi:hypothetical protein
MTCEALGGGEGLNKEHEQAAAAKQASEIREIREAGVMEANARTISGSVSAIQSFRGQVRTLPDSSVRLYQEELP